VQARSAFKEGNKAYKDENFKAAIKFYEEALKHEPDMAEAHFYLGSSRQALYRPGKGDQENVERLKQAVEGYKESLRLNTGSTPSLVAVKANTLAALTAIYADEPFKDYEQAKAYAELLVAHNPNEAKNLYAMANLYEKFGKVQEAEDTYNKIAELNPNDVKACGALAAFYNKPLWEGRSKFDQAISVLEKCAGLAPEDPGGYQKVATFFWDKAYRDPNLGDKEKDQYADKGLEAVDKALKIKPDYFEAIIFKGLLYRVKAGVATNPRLKQQYMEQAVQLQKQGLELKKEQQAAAEKAAPLSSPSPTK
jgi:tetratricopeptide (TPR) repeat protein